MEIAATRPITHIPQQGIPTQVQRSVKGPERKLSQHQFEQYLRNWQQHIKREQEKNNKLIEMSVTLHRRSRALTLSDMCGRYGIRQDTQGRWLDYDADLDGEIHPINIVGPALNTNQNACLQSQSQTEVRSANQNAKHQQAAMRWQRLSDFFERTGWDEAERAFIFDAVQKDGTVLVYSYKERVDEQTVAEVRERKLGLALYDCPCGEKGLTETEGIDEGMQSVPCPKCGAGADALVTPLMGYELEEKNVPTYKIKSDTIPFYNFTIDSYGAKIRGIPGARWLQIQKLTDRMELETRYPHLDFTARERWCYPLRCDYALASGAWDYLNRASDGSELFEFGKVEEFHIYLHEEAYSNYVSPNDFEFVNAQGKKIFSLKAGQTITEAWKSQYGYNPKGLKFIWCIDRVIDIISPDVETLNLRDCFSDVHWRRDSGSYLSSPHYSIVTIQDDITLLNTMNHNIVARNAVNQVYYDSLVFEQGDFSSEYIGSKNGAMLGEDRDISKSVVQLPVPTPSPYLSQQLQFLWSIKDDVSNVTPAMRGDAQSGETLGAVRQQLEQSYGSLTSVLKSFAQCKNNVFRQKANIAKECWTLEQFQRVGSMFGEVWTEEDVSEMCEMDLDEDLIVSYKTGSEMPQSNIDRDLRFMQGLTALMPFIEAGIPLSPDKYQKILEKIDETAGFEFDLSGLEVNEMVAQKRYLSLADICTQFADVTFDEVQEQKTAIAAVDEATQMPITRIDLIAEQIFAQADIRFSQYEDLEQQKTFFIEQVRVEIGKTKPNFVLIEMLHILLGMLEQTIAMLAQQALMASPEYQAQMAAEAAAKESEAANAERDDANKAADRDLKREESAANAENAAMGQMVGLLQSAAGQEHEIEKMKLGAELAPKDKPKGDKK